MWASEWVGIPYAKLGRGPENYDCLGLFVALQRVRHGRVIRDPMCSVAEAARHRIADRHKMDWHRIDVAQEGDAMLFRVRGLQLHIAYALGPRLMLHSNADLGESAIEDIRSSLWVSRLEGIYRYAA